MSQMNRNSADADLRKIAREQVWFAFALVFIMVLVAVTTHG
jgi:hypothetical protein